MILLTNNCRYSGLNVTPQNWENGGVKTLNRVWYISYRFYDGDKKLHPKYGKPIIIKGFNQYKTLDDRRAAVRKELAILKELLEEKGYNPLTGSFFEKPFEPADDTEREISEYTPFIEALKFIVANLKKAESTMKDIKRRAAIAGTIAKQLYIDHLPVSQIKRRHLKQLCERSATLIRGDKAGEFSADKYNRMRSDLMIIYGELLEYDAVEANIPESLKIQKGTIKKIRDTLTDKQRAQIDKHLKAKHYSFWRFMHIFFHSGARQTEIMRVKVKDVDLKNQRVKYLVQKEKQYIEKYRPIRNRALPLWKEAISGADADWYVFSRNRKAGPVHVDAGGNKQFWYDNVKIPLGITADFYSLKHTNATETSEALGQQAAADFAAESKEMIAQHYDVLSAHRKNEALKNSDVSFVPKKKPA